jgi:hypothetical protein
MSSSRSGKRRRTNVGIGAPSEADSPANQMNAPSSASSSTRRVVINVLPLTTICLNVFVQNFHRFSSEPNIWAPTSRWRQCSESLRTLPDSMIPRLLKMLVETCPNLLSSELIKEVRVKYLIVSPFDRSSIFFVGIHYTCPAVWGVG